MRSQQLSDQLPTVSDDTREFAAKLRKSMTEEELILWSQLKGRRLGVKFLRQRPLGKYIGDFVSLEVALVVELDGSQHYQDIGTCKDKSRDEFLRDHGFKVLRFSNLDVRRNLNGVLEVIRLEIEASSSGKI
jgi:very-short-patch-repair endonuclease